MTVGFIGLAFATIVVGSNRYEWTEAERLKFLIKAPLLLLSLQGIRSLYQTFNSDLRAFRMLRWTATPLRPTTRKEKIVEARQRQKIQRNASWAMTSTLFRARPATSAGT
jgi:hypothetical protein